MNTFLQKIGAWHTPAGTEFIVWAPFREQVELLIEPLSIHPMQKDEWGYWKVTLSAPPGTKYSFRLDGRTTCPDPASLIQPDGVHGPSEVADREGFSWEDETWQGVPLSNMILYELHVGAFSPAHDLEGVLHKLDHLVELGINTIELMPLAQFPGTRNWGYDGVYPFAVQASYGGVKALKQLVNAAHLRGIAVVLDVVYNHLGPEGNYLQEYGPYFTDKYHTPWGKPLNFDDAWCDGVRNFFLQNARMWLEDFHIDGLRLDAVHAIWDFSAHVFLRQLKEQAWDIGRRTNRRKELIAELDLNDPKYIQPPEKGGYGLDGQWSDEFHHSLHSLLTGERQGYYEDFGEIAHLERAFRDTYVYNGIYSPRRKKIFGLPAGLNPYSQFVVCSQNHDQVGNRLRGDRLAETLDLERLKLAAATVLLSPYIPLLFMGEEYGEKNPFLFFTDFGDPALIEAVRKGRKEEFAYAVTEDFPDPQDPATFERSVLSWAGQGEAAVLFAYYRSLIAFRKSRAAMQGEARDSLLVHPSNDKVLAFERKVSPDHLFIWLNFNPGKVILKNGQPGILNKVFDSASDEWSGPSERGPCESKPGDPIELSPYAALVFENKL